ncbi:GntR family transcriptional regulator [Phytohabitans sp. LJ34]|uniref:GntR family transcriptional regulator n=1 Tax=Phytohabitans sp. LJ34 TaxID=3452217 RepID=UPI003F8C0F29
MVRAGTPRYMVIEEHLRKLIGAGQPGDPLPSDSELCERFSVSRMTARQAVMRLVNEGAIYRVPGSGSFIADRHIHRGMNRLLSFTEDMRARGRVVSSRVLSAGLREGAPDELRALHLAPGDRVVAVTRVRLADGVPLALERAVLPPSMAPILEADLATTSLHELSRELGREPTKALGSLTAVTASPLDAELLEVKVGGGLLVERRTILDQQGAPMEYTETSYVGDRYLFDVVLERG